MKTAKYIFAFALVVAAISSLADDTNVVPKHFKASIETFKRPSYTVELRDSVLVYSIMVRGTNTEIKITPTFEQWQEFRHTLDNLKVWQWQTRYYNPNYRDGTGWRLDIGYADHSIRVGGGNSYPDTAGKPSDQPTVVFTNYLAAVQKLLGGKTFGK